MVAVGVAINQVRGSDNVWSLPWLAAALVLAGLTVWLDRRRNDGQAAPPGPRLHPHLAGADGLPVLLEEVSPEDLGVHESKFGGEAQAPYVARERVDELLTAALTTGERRVVIVQGPRLAGCTRTLAHAARRLLFDHRVAWFFDNPQVPLAAMLAQAGRWARHDLDDYDSPAMGAVLWLERLSPDRFTELAQTPLEDLPEGVWILATLDPTELEQLRDRAQLDKAVDAAAVRITMATITDRERAELKRLDAYARLRADLDQTADLYMGRLMVAWDSVRTALTLGSGEQATDRIALLRAVTDWHRVRMPRLLTDDILKPLYAEYRAELTITLPPHSSTGLADAVAWATTATPPSKSATGRPRLIDVSSDSGRRVYSPHPLLTAFADDHSEPAHWHVADTLWAYADRFLDGPQRRAIGLTALRLEAYRAAAQILDHTDAPADPLAFFTIARWLHANDDLAAGRYWYRSVIETGHPEHAPAALLDLGALEYEQGRVGEARRWWCLAVDTGHAEEAPKAMVYLGVLEDGQGRVEEARRWYGRAVETGHADQALMAMFNLGVLEYELGRVEEARRWYGRAVETGHADQALPAMVNLGILEDDQGRVEEARRWLRQVIDTRHPDYTAAAMVNLGIVEKGQGRVEEARRWLRQAEDNGHPDYAPRAQQLLRGLDRHEDEQRRATRFAKYGWQAWADPGLMRRPSTDTDRASDAAETEVAEEPPPQ